MPACVPAESCEEGSWETDDLSAPFFIHSSMSKHRLLEVNFTNLGKSSDLSRPVFLPVH